MIIKNAPVPRSCRECDSWGLSDVVTIVCPVDRDGSLYSFTDRPEGCPLTQDREPSATTPAADVVPVRHGRNISNREIAIKAVKKEREYTGEYSFEEEHAWAVGFHQGISFALSDIASIPAADVQPVRHGRWTKTIGENGVTSACRCNLCGFEDNRYSLFNYCPNCGAKMEGEA